jgi:aspartyl-tRNA(Asn)/glutamyl-tRNA(Gln) amidotransferase subunit C
LREPLTVGPAKLVTQVTRWPVASTLMSERLTRSEVVHVAKLARLALTEAELDTMTNELGNILGTFDAIAALDMAGVSPTAHPLALVNVLRPDVVRPSADREEVLACAPAAEDNRFRVPKILGEA